MSPCTGIWPRKRYIFFIASTTNTLIKLQDASGTVLQVVQLTNGWSHELRLRIRGEDADAGRGYHHRGAVSGSIPFKAPEERDDWCNQVEGFLADAGSSSVRIRTGRYGRSGGHLERDTDDTLLLTIKSPRYSNSYRFRIADPAVITELISVLRSVD